MTLPSFWHCNTSAVVSYNTSNSTLSDKILTPLDSLFSVFGGAFNIFLLSIIIIRSRRLGNFPSSSIFYANICIVNIIECANSICIYRNVLRLAWAVEDMVHFTRSGFLVPIYGIRLLYIVKTNINPFGSVNLRISSVMVLVVWMLGIAASVFGYGIRQLLLDADYSTPTASYYNRVAFWLITANLVWRLLAHLLMVCSIQFIAGLYMKFRKYQIIEPSRDTADGFQFVNRANMLFYSINSAFKFLIILYLIDLVSSCYQTMLTFLGLPVYYTNGQCIPYLLLRIRQFFSTRSSFLYSIHISGVLFGVLVCFVLFSRAVMRRTAKFVWCRFQMCVASNCFPSIELPNTQYTSFRSMTNHSSLT